MAKTYDLVVIGTGTAATVAANRCRAAGWRVAVVDHLPYGGTCALRGCDPKKVLVGAAEAVDHARRMRGKGVGGGEPSIDWPVLIGFKRSFTEPVPAMMETSFKKNGIETYHGRARFAGPRSVEVAGEALEARFVLIAAGAVPVKLGIPGEELVISSTEFLELNELPKRIVLVGGGYIAAEFSHIAARGREGHRLAAGGTPAEAVRRRSRRLADGEVARYRHRRATQDARRADRKESHRICRPRHDGWQAGIVRC